MSDEQRLPSRLLARLARLSSAERAELDEVILRDLRALAGASAPPRPNTDEPPRGEGA